MPISNINSSLCLNLLENSPSFIIMIDEQGRIFWLNQSFCDFLGLERDTMIGLSADDAKEPCLAQVLGAKPRVEIFAGILNKWIELQDLMSFNGEQFGLENQELKVCYYADASQRVQTEKQLLQLESTLTHKMSHDSVTGMLNHHSMFQTLSSEVSRSRRYNNPLSLVLMKVEYQADETSQQEMLVQENIEQMRLMISQLLKDQMRWADIVGHFEEYDFVLLLPETDYESAKVLIKKLDEGMNNVAPNTQHIRYGLSQWQKGDDVLMFLERAARELNTETA